MGPSKTCFHTYLSRWNNFSHHNPDIQTHKTQESQAQEEVCFQHTLLKSLAGMHRLVVRVLVSLKAQLYYLI